MRMSGAALDFSHRSILYPGNSNIQKAYTSAIAEDFSTEDYHARKS